MSLDNAVPLEPGTTGRHRIRVMLLAKGHTIASWARAADIAHVEQAHMAISGAREYPEIREKLAAFLGLTREQIDELIDGPADQTAEEVA